MARNNRTRAREEKERLKEARQYYLAKREAEVAQMNANLACQVETLTGILEYVLTNVPVIRWEAMRQVPKRAQLDADPQYAIPVVPDLRKLMPWRVWGVLPYLRPWHEARCQRAYQRHEALIERQNKALAIKEGRWNQLKTEASEHNAALEARRIAFYEGDPANLCSVVKAYLEASHYSEGHPALPALSAHNTGGVYGH